MIQGGAGPKGEKGVQGPPGPPVSYSTDVAQPSFGSEIFSDENTII